MTTGLGFLTDCIRSELQEVESLFHQELSSELSCVNTLIRHVSRFRGKMLRPSLVLLCGKACGPIGRPHIVVGTVVEMVHMATLVHDDVLDDAELRRKGATINHLRGNEAAVLLGDYLISHSYHLCSSLDSQLASRLIGRATNLVCEGELLQIDHRNDIDLDEETYLKIISRKTSALAWPVLSKAWPSGWSCLAFLSASRFRFRMTFSTWSAMKASSARRWAAISKKGR
jgi:octaprenyl-diphosphate synthase